MAVLTVRTPWYAWIIFRCGTYRSRTGHCRDRRDARKIQQNEVVACDLERLYSGVVPRLPSPAWLASNCSSRGGRPGVMLLELSVVEQRYRAGDGGVVGSGAGGRGG